MVVDAQLASGPPTTKMLLKMHWKRLISGTLLGSAGLGYCLFLHLKNHSKWTFLPLIAGSVGVTLVNSAIMEMFETSPTCPERVPIQPLSSENLEPPKHFSTANLYRFRSIYEDLADIYLDLSNNLAIMISKIDCEKCKQLARKIYNEKIREVPVVPKSDSIVTFDMLYMRKRDEKECRKSEMAYNDQIDEYELTFKRDLYRTFDEFETLIYYTLDPTLPQPDPHILGMTQEDQEFYMAPFALKLTPQACEVANKMIDLFKKLRFAVEQTVYVYTTDFRRVGKEEIEKNRFARLQGTVQVIDKEDVLSVEKDAQTNDTSVFRKSELQMAEAEPSSLPADESMRPERKQKDSDKVSLLSESFLGQLGAEDAQSIRDEIGDMVKDLKRRKSKTFFGADFVVNPKASPDMSQESPSSVFLPM